MSGVLNGEASAPVNLEADYQKISATVCALFQVDEAFLEQGIPTFRLKEAQETKHAFLKLLKSLEPMNLVALLRRIEGKVILRVVPKPKVKPSNILVNWVLFFATIGTTFYTGYLLSFGLVERGAMSDPFVGAVAFVIAIMAVLGTHEMGHKLTANKNKMDATSPYFIPGPPPNVGGFGTFGAVIMQKSLPPNRDALFDIGCSGPVVGFLLALVASIVGLFFSPQFPKTGNESFMPIPMIFELLIVYVIRPESGYYLLAHPVSLAGWVGMIVTMLNLLPAGMLDGGHVARSILGEKLAMVFSGLSFIYLIVIGFIPMAIFLLFVSLARHPGPLDEVSSLSQNRKLLTLGLIAIFALCSFPIF